MDFSAGKRIAFIYPDLETALIGKFVKGVMIEAKATKVIQVNRPLP